MESIIQHPESGPIPLFPPVAVPPDALTSFWYERATPVLGGPPTTTEAKEQDVDEGEAAPAQPHSTGADAGAGRSTDTAPAAAGAAEPAGAVEATGVTPPDPSTPDADVLVRKNRSLARALTSARRELAAAQEEIERLTAPPLSFATHVTVVDAMARTIDVVVAGRRMRVTASSALPLGGLEPGTALVLDERLNAVATAEPDDVGELVTVEQRLDERHVLVAVRSEDTRVLRLSPALVPVRLRPGDALMADLKDGVALRRVARREVEEMSEKDLAREIKRLEKQMLEHARNLEFEQAAQARDQLALLKTRVLGAAG